jgi:hypothetical protein
MRAPKSLAACFDSSRVRGCGKLRPTFNSSPGFYGYRGRAVQFNAISQHVTPQAESGVRSTARRSHASHVVVNAYPIAVHGAAVDAKQVDPYQ